MRCYRLCFLLYITLIINHYNSFCQPIQFQKSLGLMGPFGALQADHGDYVVAATKLTHDCIIRLDSTGAIKWSKKYDVISTAGFGLFNFIHRTSDDGFITGHYYSPGSEPESGRRGYRQQLVPEDARHSV